MIVNKTLGHQYNNSDAYVKKQFKIRDERIDLLEKKVEALIRAGQTAKTELNKAKDLEELKITELKILCDENGIDYTGFGNKKSSYIVPLQAKGL